MDTSKLGKDLQKKTQNTKLVPYSIIAIIVLILFLLLGKLLISAILVLSVVLSAFFVSVLNLKKSGIELVTLTTVIFGVVYGPAVGAITGLILIIIQLLFGQYINIYILWVIPGYALAGFLAGTLALNIVTLGIALVVGLNLFFVIMTLLITPPAIAHYLPYAFLNLVFNVILFKFFSEIILSLMI